MNAGRLTGQEPDERFLIEMGFSSVEISRVAAIKGRPRNHQGLRSDIMPLPRLFSEYSGLHKRCYAEVFGDAAAEVIFGYGPWLGRYATTCRNGHPKSMRNSRGKCQECARERSREHRARRKEFALT